MIDWLRRRLGGTSAEQSPVEGQRAYGEGGDPDEAIRTLVASLCWRTHGFVSASDGVAHVGDRRTRILVERRSDGAAFRASVPWPPEEWR